MGIGVKEGRFGGGVKLCACSDAPVPGSSEVPGLMRGLCTGVPRVRSTETMLVARSCGRARGRPVVVHETGTFRRVLRGVPVAVHSLRLIIKDDALTPEKYRAFPRFSCR